MPHLRTPDWYETATRWSQLTFVETDPPALDKDFWLELFARTQSNAVCLSAGGYVAYYPSRIPLHHVSRDLGARDCFGDMVAGARQLGLHVAARVDPHAVHDEVRDAHPEWIACRADGSHRRHWAFPEAWVTCALGGYNRDFMTGVIAEIAAGYDIDAVFANRWDGHGVCYCAHCKTAFHAASEYDIPLARDPRDPVWQAYVAWSRGVLTALVVHWNDTVRAHKPHARFIPNMGSDALLDYDLKTFRDNCPILFVDNQGRFGVTPIWAAGRDGKRMRGIMGDRPIGMVTSVGLEELPRWKDSVQTAPELRLWIADGAAHGLRPWYTKFNAVVPDRRWVAPIVESFRAHAAVEAELAPLEPVAEIALLDPSTTLRAWDRADREAVEAHERGFYHALVEAGLPFELVSDLGLEDGALAPFKLLVLANAAFLSDGQCAAIRAFVAAGGSLVAAFESARYDELGRPRADFGLADVFGASVAGDTLAPTNNRYMELVQGHPLCAGYDGAARIIAGTRQLPVTLHEGSAAALRAIPPFPDLPMEEVYQRAPAMAPSVVVRETGAGGRVVYIAENIGETFWDVLAADHARLIGNAVRWALGRAPAVEVAGPGLVDVATRAGAGRLAVHLVNLTNPMAMKGPMREVLPVGAQQVALRWPEARPLPAARLLVAQRPVAARRAGGRIVFDVPELTIDEIVLVQFPDFEGEQQWQK